MIQTFHKSQDMNSSDIHVRSHDLTCMSEFELLNNIIIFVVLFGKTAKLLLSIMIWVEKTKTV